MIHLFSKLAEKKGGRERIDSGPGPRGASKSCKKVPSINSNNKNHSLNDVISLLLSGPGKALHATVYSTKILAKSIFLF